ncbi:MAG: hypothetical protein ABIC57_01295, partial [bacterium]
MTIGGSVGITVEVCGSAGTIGVSVTGGSIGVAVASGTGGSIGVTGVSVTDGSGEGSARGGLAFGE